MRLMIPLLMASGMKVAALMGILMQNVAAVYG
jgi:hypothetical protein